MPAAALRLTDELPEAPAIDYVGAEATRYVSLAADERSALDVVEFSDGQTRLTCAAFGAVATTLILSPARRAALRAYLNGETS